MSQLLRERLSCILTGVSRTFAINIRILSGSLYDSVLASYLVCRLFDTVEDSIFLSIQKKCEYLTFLEESFVKGCTSSENSVSLKVKKWGIENQYITNVAEEKELLRELDMLWNFFHTIHTKDKACMISSICEMSQGMRWFLLEYSSEEEKPKILKNQQHLKKYCYVVAGTVGNLLTDLFLNRLKENNFVISNIKKLGISFSQGLQMTNILKDIHPDSTRGWMYIPETVLKNFELDTNLYLKNQYPQKNILVLRQMINHTLYCLRKGFIYIQNIPIKYTQIRSFCMVALFLALRTLKELQKNTFSQKIYRNKISRMEVRKILFLLPFSSRSNTVFRFLYSRWSRL